MTLNTIPLILFTLPLFSFFMGRNNIITALLSLEFLLLYIFLSLIITYTIYGLAPTHAIYLLVIGACEASLGLTILISTGRFFGTDMIINNNNF